MPLFKPRLLSCLVAALMLLAPAAMAQNGVFDDYTALRADLDRLMKARKVDEVLIVFGGSDEMTSAQLTALRDRVQLLYPEDFDRVETIRRNDMASGWRQELLVYYRGQAYMYVYLLLHEQADKIVSVNFRFNSDFHALNDNF